MRLFSRCVTEHAHAIIRCHLCRGVERERALLCGRVWRGVGASGKRCACSRDRMGDLSCQHLLLELILAPRLLLQKLPVPVEGSNRTMAVSQGGARGQQARRMGPPVMAGKAPGSEEGARAAVLKGMGRLTAADTVVTVQV